MFHSDAPRNPIDAVGQRDHALTLVFMCTRIAMHLSRFCADMVEMCSDGLFALDGAIACGSSMMPHKRNPDLFELVRAQAALRYGELVQLMTTFQGLGSGYHRDLQQDKEILFRAFDGTVNCLKMINLALGHMKPNPERCLQALKEGDAVADFMKLIFSFASEMCSCVYLPCPPRHPVSIGIVHAMEAASVSRDLDFIIILPGKTHPFMCKWSL